MSNSTFDVSAELDIVPWHSHRVTLSPDILDWVMGIFEELDAPPSATDDAENQHHPQHDHQQWQWFLQAMALGGFKQWLETTSTDLELIYHPPQPPLPRTYCQVGGFKLCLVAMGSVPQDTVSIPQWRVDSPTDLPHFCVLVEVHEESDEVTILNSLRYDQLHSYWQQQMDANPAQTASSSGHSDRSSLSIGHFDTPPHQLHLYLECLNPAMLSQGAHLATAQAESTKALTMSSSVINVSRWLSDQIDTVTSALNWVLIPPLAPANAMMTTPTPAEELETILRNLQPQGVAIPPEARGAFIDIQLDLQQNQLPFRLYALTWNLGDVTPPEWSLFLVLVCAPGEPMVPAGTRLVVRDQDTVLSDCPVPPEDPANPQGQLLYTQIVGTWDEQFTVTVVYPDGTMLTWPPFAFSPES